MLYADDTVILSDSAENLQKSLDSFLKYCSEWKLQINNTKTKVVIFGAHKTNLLSFKLGNTKLEIIVDNYKYLGTVFSSTRSFLKARKHFAEQARKAMHLLQMRIKNLNLPVDLQLKLFDQTILPIITYSCDFFGFENCANLELIHTKFLRSIIQARKSTPLYMIYGELGRYPIEITIKTKMINYWSRLTNCKHSKLVFILYQKMRASEEKQFKWLSKMKQILDESGRSDLWLNQPFNFNCSRTIKSVLEAQFLQTWSTKLDASSKGLNYRLFKDSIKLEPYFVKLPRTLFMHLGQPPISL